MVLVAVVAVATAVMLCLPRWPHPQSFYDFADQRTILGVPNFSDVVSNAGLAVAGAAGVLFLIRRGAGLGRMDRWALGIMFGGVLLSAVGSAYFHLAPSDATLFWDRLPMSVAFMGFFAGVLTERVSRRAGAWLLAPLVLLGMASVIYWRWTEVQGAGDQRFYALVQGLPLLALPYLALAFPAKYLPARGLLVALGWYGLALALQALDTQVYALGGVVSGHTLKHLAAAMGAYWILRTIARAASGRRGAGCVS